MVILRGQEHIKTRWRPVTFHGNSVEYKCGTSIQKDRPAHCFLTLAASSENHNVTVWRPSDCPVRIYHRHEY